MSTPKYRHIVIPEAGDGMRLDRILSRWFHHLSRSAMARHLKQGLVTDDEGRVLRPSTRVRAQQGVRVYIPGIAPTGTPPPMPRVLFEDDRLAVVYKPAGMVAHPAGPVHQWSVIGLAKTHWPEHSVDLVHRLDKDTSGCLVLSKDQDANLALKDAFRTRDTRKEYVGVVRGRPEWDSLTVRAPIGRAGGPIRVQMAVQEDGLSARTDVAVTLRGQPGEGSWVRCVLHTGRTHQIRVHLAHVGHPLLGDLLYGLPLAQALAVKETGVTPALRQASGAPRQALHAQLLGFPHPSGGRVEVEAPIPPEFERWRCEEMSPD